MGKKVTTKSLTKRVRITRNGKMIRRSMGVNHFKTRKSTNNNRGKRKLRTFSGSDSQKIANY